MPSDVVELQKFPVKVQGPAGGDARTATSVRKMGEPLGSRTLWLKARLYEIIGSYQEITAIDAATDTLTIAGHGLVTDQQIGFRAVAGGALPAELVGVLGYTKVVDADHIQVAATAGGAAIDLTTAGSGDRYLIAMVDAAAAIVNAANGVLPLGTLKEQLSYIITNFGRKAAANVWTAANTFQDRLVRSGVGAVDEYRASSPLADATPITTDYSAECFDVPDVSQSTIINLPAPTTGRRVQRYKRKAAASAFGVVLKYGATSIATLPGSSTWSWVDVETTTSSWTVSAFGGTASPLA